jgi:hypothetical protein
MQPFLHQHSSVIHGVLSGFDRVRFRGTLRSVCHADGLFRYLCFLKVLLVAFKEFFDGTARKLKLATERLAATTPVGRVVYLSGMRDKEAVVRDLIREHALADDYTGVIAVLSCVENCRSFALHRNAASRMLELVSAYRKCLHYYVYLRHPRFGMMHVRLMTWFPMQVQICLNGREWLSRQLDAAGVAYERRDNCFTWVADFAKAQALLDQQLQTDWSATLTGVIRESHPEFARLLTEWQLRDYYWTAEQTEWATDVVFHSADALRGLYRRLVRHATENLSCSDVLRFLQQRLTKSGAIHGRFQGEVVSDTKTRVEGTRVKHRLGRNSLKMYDKFGQVLRIETTIHQAEGLKVYRPKEGDESGTLAGRPLRRGVADVYRRCQLSQAANESYLAALAVVESPETLGPSLVAASRTVTKNGRRYRGLNLLSSDDGDLLRAINRGEFAITGFQNRHLRSILFGPATTNTAETKRQSGQMTRQLQRLRAHGLSRKIPKSHRYKITDQGRLLATATTLVHDTSLKSLALAT